MTVQALLASLRSINSILFVFQVKIYKEEQGISYFPLVEHSEDRIINRVRDNEILNAVTDRECCNFWLFLAKTELKWNERGKKNEEHGKQKIWFFNIETVAVKALYWTEFRLSHFCSYYCRAKSERRITIRQSLSECFVDSSYKLLWAIYKSL